jgi:predicted DNA-binding antitoxin AbrB/MazE fold protein
VEHLTKEAQKMKRTELKQGDKVKIIVRDSNNKEIHTNNEGKIYEVIRKSSKLGVNWNEGTNHGLIYGNFVPLDGFVPYPHTEFIKIYEG